MERIRSLLFNEKLSLVKSFVSDFTSIPIEKIKDESTLLHDLGITGDDADDFFDLFSEKFNLDINFDLGMYFPSEGDVLIRYTFFLFKNEKFNKKYKPFTILMLVHSIMNRSFNFE